MAVLHNRLYQNSTYFVTDIIIWKGFEVRGCINFEIGLAVRPRLFSEWVYLFWEMFITFKIFSILYYIVLAAGAAKFHELFIQTEQKVAKIAKFLKIWQSNFVCKRKKELYIFEIFCGTQEKKRLNK